MQGDAEESVQVRVSGLFDQKLVDLMPGFAVPVGAKIEVSDHRGYHVVAELALIEGRYEVHRLVVERIADGEPITTESLRDMAIGQLTSAALVELVQKVTRREGGGLQVDFRDKWHMAEHRTGYGLLPVDDARALRAAGPNRETLEAVASVYTFAVALGVPPTRAVRETFEISQSTAGAWVGRARAAGLLADVPEVPGSTRLRGSD